MGDPLVDPEVVDAAALELAAKAFAAEDVGWDGTGAHPWESWDESIWSDYRDSARAAISTYLAAAGVPALVGQVEEWHRAWATAKADASEEYNRMKAENDALVGRLAEAEKYAKEGWDWLDEVLGAIDKDATVFNYREKLEAREPK